MRTNHDPDFGDLMKIHEMVFNYFRKVTGSRERAEDIAGETILRMLDNREKFEKGSNVRAWAYIIARNFFYGEQRRRGRGIEMPMEDDVELVANFVPSSDDPFLTVYLKQVLERLPKAINEEQCRALSYEIVSASYTEMAKLLKANEGTVKSRVARARRALCEYFEEPPPTHGKQRGNDHAPRIHHVEGARQSAMPFLRRMPRIA